MITFKSIFCVCGYLLITATPEVKDSVKCATFAFFYFIVLLRTWYECEGGNDEMLINMETVKGRDITLDKKPQRGPL